MRWWLYWATNTFFVMAASQKGGFFIAPTGNDESIVKQNGNRSCRFYIKEIMD
jgi:hypothetical protein